MNANAIAIIGFAGRFPGARSIAQFWANVRDGVESITTFTDSELRASGVSEDRLHHPDYVKSGAVLEDFDRFDAAFFGFSPRDAEIMDPQQRVFLECAWEALEHAGHDPSRFPGSVGVFAGSGMTAYMTFNLAPNRRLMEEIGLFLLRHTGNDKDFLSTRVSYELDLKGPSLNVQTACSTSLVAVHVAAQHLLNGECDMALAGGVTIEVPHGEGYTFKESEILSPDGHCRAFDAAAKGTVFGSGAGVVVLRRLADALKDGNHIHALIIGSAVNNDGSAKMGYLAPSVDGQAAAVVEALTMADAHPETITFVETHGTGTALGDPIEIAALTQAYRAAGARKRGYCAIGSAKTNIGHLDTAAGVASLIKAVLALEHRQLPPSLHYQSPNPAIDFENSPFFVNTALQPWNAEPAVPRRAGVNSLGVGGTNAHVVLEEAPPRRVKETESVRELLVLSAKTSTALDDATANLVDHLQVDTAPFSDIAWTLQVGRQEFAHRRCLVARNPHDAVRLLEENDPRQVLSASAPSVPRTIAFMFAGGGAQHPDMARELYDTEQAFRREVDRCLGIVSAHVPADLGSLLFPADGDRERAARELERPSLALPALFITQYALAQLWRAWGIESDGMIGHSVGEYTAACLAGVFSVEDALTLVTLRGRLFERLPAGAMLSVPLSTEQLKPMLSGALSIAAVNAPGLSVVSGPIAAVEELENALKARDLDAQRIHISVAAHSSMLDSILAEFRASVAQLRLRVPNRPFVSNLTGTWAGEEVAQADYWVRHLREPVQFSQGLGALLSDPARVLLEVGPGRTLATLAKLHPALKEGHAILTSLPHPEERASDASFLLTTLGQLWLRGATVNWNAVHDQQPRRRVPLPTYPFERQRYWIDAPQPTSEIEHDRAPAKRSANIDEWFWQPVWRRVGGPRTLDGASPRRPGVLIFEGNQDRGVGARAKEILAARGERVVVAAEGRQFRRTERDRYETRPASQDDAAAMLRDLAKTGGVPGRLLHLWTLGDATTAEEDRERGMETLVSVAQAIGNEEVGGHTTLVVAASGSQAVAGDAVPSPGRALSVGILRVIAREYPDFICRFVDVAPGLRADDIAIRLCEEMDAAGPDLVAYRGRERMTMDFAPVRLQPSEQSMGLRTCGVYLITGGMGGLGGVVASELALRAQARLALVSRREIPPRADWALWLATHDNEDGTSARIRRVLELEDAGAEVLPLVADLSRAEDAARVVNETRRRFGMIHGVVHAAGILDDGPLQLRSREQRDRVLGPKVAATLALEEALGSAPLDFFVAFSSVSVQAGLTGQSDYSAANAFLDAHAHQRRERGARSVSIAWSAWKDVGMVAALARAGSPSQMQEPGGPPIAIDHPVLRAGVRDRDDDVYTGLLDPRTDWIVGEHRLQDGPPLMPGTGYLELARAAFETSGKGRMELTDVFFLTPFVVPDGETRELQIRLTRATGEFVIQGRRPGTEPWDEHVRGVACARAASGSALSLAAIKARCNVERETPGEAHPYLHFGPRWNSVASIDYGTSEALVALELPAAFTADLAHMPLHPALLDMATAGAQRLIEGHDPANGLFVPIGYGAVRVSEPLPARLFSHIRYRRPEGRSKDIALFDVTIADNMGNVIADISDFTMKRTRAESLAQSIVVRRPAVPSIVQELEAAISPIEGAAAFLRILGSDAPSHIVVSPQPFDALLEQWRAHGPPARGEKGQEMDASLEADLERIAAVLAGHEAVREAKAVAKRGRGKSRRIIGYVVFRPGESATMSELRRRAKGLLPRSLVPSNFIDLEEFPRKADGDIDGSALPDPFDLIDNFVAPRTATEKAIAQVWRDVLGVSRVGAHDNFFDSGGHSLLSVRVITRIYKTLGVRLDQATMVLHTLEQIAAKCDERLTDAPKGGSAVSR